jgi:hypothetical protein
MIAEIVETLIEARAHEIRARSVWDIHTTPEQRAAAAYVVELAEARRAQSTVFRAVLFPAVAGTALFGFFLHKVKKSA